MDVFAYQQATWLLVLFGLWNLVGLLQDFMPAPRILKTVAHLMSDISIFY